MISRSHLRDPLAWVFIVTVVVSLLGIYDMAREIGAPFGGYVSYRRAAIPTGEVDANTPSWWSGMINDRLSYGVTLLTADGRPYYPHIRAAFAAAAAEARPVTLTFLLPDGNQFMTSDLPAEPFTLARFLDVRLPDLIMAAVFWLLAFIVYRSDPASPTNRAFAATAALVGMVRALYVHSLFLDDLTSTLIELLLLGTIPLVGVALINFAANFPTPVTPRRRRIVSVTLAVALTVALVASAAAVIARLPGLAPWVYNAAAAVTYNLTVGLYLVGLFAVLARLLNRIVRRRRLPRRERRLLYVVLAGMIVALPMLLISAFTWVIIDGRHLSYYLTGLDMRYTLLAVPLAFTYGLLRYRSLHAPPQLFVVVMLLSVSAIVAALGAWAWTWNHPDWPGNGLRPPFPSLFFAALASGAFWVALSSARGVLGRIFHYERRAYGAARDFGRRITGRTDLRELPTTVTEALVDELELERAAIWLVEEDGPTLTLAGRAGRFRAPLPPTLSTDLTAGGRNVNHRRAALSGTPLRINRGDTAPGWLRPIAGGSNFEVALPLVADGHFIGVIALGPRWDEGVFDERDLESAELIAQQATLFLIAAARITELRRVPGRVADVQDRERQRLAQELHDTIQQFLGRLPFYLTVGRNAVDNNPHTTRDILDQAIADVEEAAATVRQIRHDLAPSRLERGLADSVVELCRRFEQRTGIATTVTVDSAVDGQTSIDVRYAIYRVIQQSLDNVEAHARASEVAVALVLDEGAVRFSVIDDGCGSSENERQAARLQGSYGLESMRARLEAHGGEFNLASAPGRGTQISGRVPIPVAPT